MWKPLRILAALFAIGCLTQAHAGAFWPASVYKLPEDDPGLVIRHDPSPKALEIGKAQFGESLSLSGLCRNTGSGAEFFIQEKMPEMGEDDRTKQLAAVAELMAVPEVWCNIMFVGSFEINGWARGKYIWPDSQVPGTTPAK